MRITELLKQESIGLNVSVSTKEEAIDKLVDLMAAGGRLKDKAGYKEGILAREALGSTGIGGGIAIPHAKVEAVKGLDWQPWWCRQGLIMRRLTVLWQISCL